MIVIVQCLCAFIKALLPRYAICDSALIVLSLPFHQHLSLPLSNTSSSFSMSSCFVVANIGDHMHSIDESHDSPCMTLLSHC